MDERRQRVMAPLVATAPEIGRWLWALEDTRRRTKDVLVTVPPAALDWVPERGGNSIGALLYHIALIEADYLAVDVLELAVWPADVAAHFPAGDRDATGMLTVPPATTLARHLERLDAVRSRLLAVFGAMTVEDFRRPRTLPEYEITPEWTLHHLMQHEAEHRGQIETLRDFAFEPGR